MPVYTIISRIQLIVAVCFLFTPIMLSAQEDDPSLINVTTLEQLDAIRYDTDGDGIASSQVYTDAFGTPSCAGSCYGYELMNDLDFRESKWAEDATGPDAVSGGWPPIGDANDSFNATLDGNGYMISNLYINRPDTDNVGLFGYTRSFTLICTLGVVEGSVIGNLTAGILVGNNSGGTIIDCYTTGYAETIGMVAPTGGLVGYNQAEGSIRNCYSTADVVARGSGSLAGSLVGDNLAATIRTCYATGNARAEGSATSDVGGGKAGGLIGRSILGGLVSSCYATGNATATGSGGRAGGLMGENSLFSWLTSSYSTGSATSTGSGGIAGGLVGGNAGTLRDSYFDYETSGRTSSERFAKSTSELQSPTMYDDNSDDRDESSIYELWDRDADGGLLVGVDDGTMPGDDTWDDPWDFGTSSEYPALKVDFDKNGTATVAEFGNQRGTSLEIRSFSPESGTVAAPIKIAGTDFSSTISEDSASFDGGTTYVVANDFIADTQTGADPTIDTVVVNVPTDAVTGTIWVKVNDGTPVESANEFTVLPSITSISPTRGAVGEEVTITGHNFGATAADNMVTFAGDESDTNDDVPVPVSDITATNTTELIVRVPAGAVTGPIEVEVDGETATSETFTVTDGAETPFSVSKSSDVIRVYPNPTSDELRFTGLSATATYMYKLYSLLGQEMLSDVVRSSTTIDMSRLSEGQYILVLSSEEDSEVLRTRLLIVR